jgi:hypothetical protein
MAALWGLRVKDERLHSSEAHKVHPLPDGDSAVVVNVNDEFHRSVTVVDARHDTKSAEDTIKAFTMFCPRQSYRPSLTWGGMVLNMFVFNPPVRSQRAKPSAC